MGKDFNCLKTQASETVTKAMMLLTFVTSVRCSLLVILSRIVPTFYQLEEGDHLKTDALRVSTPGIVAGAAMRVLGFMTMGFSSVIITC